jgi:restriction endonuclease S subunit
MALTSKNHKINALERMLNKLVKDRLNDLFLRSNTDLTIKYIIVRDLEKENSGLRYDVSVKIIGNLPKSAYFYIEGLIVNATKYIEPNYFNVEVFISVSDKDGKTVDGTVHKVRKDSIIIPDDGLIERLLGVIFWE